MANHIFVSFNDQSSYSLLSTDPLTSRCMVFVHGFFGDNWTTWEQFQELVDIGGAVSSEFWSKTDLYFFDYGAERDFVNRSAENLNIFLEQIYPVPNEMLYNLSQIRPTIVPYSYSKLLLVGHSLGAVVIRQCVANALKLRTLEPDKKLPQWLTDCELRLFAPAHRGFVPSSWKALLFGLGNWVPFLSSLPLVYRAYSDLQKGSPLLMDLRRRTESLAKENSDLKCLRARILYGSNEDVVYPGDFDCDYPPGFQDGVGHIEVCKPSLEYTTPLEFVANALLERTTAI